MRHHQNGHHHHEHDHHGGHNHAHDHHHHDDGHPLHGPGHNHPHSARAAAQWQTPHQPNGAPSAPSLEPDLDKVEAAFVDGFLVAADPTSFLRLARVPFEIAIEGASLKLLRVEIDMR